MRRSFPPTLTLWMHLLPAVFWELFSVLFVFHTCKAGSIQHKCTQVSQWPETSSQTTVKLCENFSEIVCQNICQIIWDNLLDCLKIFAWLFEIIGWFFSKYLKLFVHYLLIFVGLFLNLFRLFENYCVLDDDLQSNYMRNFWKILWFHLRIIWPIICKLLEIIWITILLHLTAYSLWKQT